MLDDEETKFLSRLGFSEDDILDARGLSKKQYHPLAKSMGIDIVISSSTCRAAGHRLRTRSGHCVQCNTANLSFLQRHSSTSHFFLASGNDGKVTKVGITTEPNGRLMLLNYQRYAGVSDWRLYRSLEVEEAGTAKDLALAVLSNYRCNGMMWDNGGIIREAQDVFDLPVSVAFEQIRPKLEQQYDIQDGAFTLY